MPAHACIMAGMVRSSFGTLKKEPATMKVMLASAAFALAALVTVPTQADLQQGAPDLQEAGPLAFAPEGVLLVGDPQSAAVFAIDTGDKKAGKERASLNVEGIDEKIAAMLGTTTKQILINDVAVNPESKHVYLSVSRGRGPDALPVILRVDGAGKISELSLKDVPFAKASLPNAPADAGSGRRNQRRESITDLAYVDGQVFVAGLSNEEFASKLRSIPYPFGKVNEGTSVEIYHGAHGKFETRSPVRTFAPFEIGGEPHLLAAYTCTPLVKFPVSDLKPGQKLQGVTLAELGNRNRPLDMIVYQKDGKRFILMANSSRGMMKISTENIEHAEGITKKINDTAGLPYQTLAEMKGVVQLDRLDERQAVVLVQTESGSLNLRTIELP